MAVHAVIFTTCLVEGLAAMTAGGTSLFRLLALVSTIWALCATHRRASCLRAPIVRRPLAQTSGDRNAEISTAASARSRAPGRAWHVRLRIATTAGKAVWNLPIVTFV